MESSSDIQHLVDRQQIVDLVDRYLATLDEHELDNAAARSLFTDDVSVEFPLGVLDGIEEVTREHGNVMAYWEHTLHLSSNHRVRIDADSASVGARLTAIHVHPATTEARSTLIAFHVLEANAVRSQRGWRFARFALRPIWTTGDAPPGLEPSSASE